MVNPPPLIPHPRASTNSSREVWQFYSEFVGKEKGTNSYFPIILCVFNAVKTEDMMMYTWCMSHRSLNQKGLRTSDWETPLLSLTLNHLNIISTLKEEKGASSCGQAV